jgi:hypothetical protein
MGKSSEIARKSRILSASRRSMAMTLSDGNHEGEKGIRAIRRCRGWRPGSKVTPSRIAQSKKRLACLTCTPFVLRRCGLL